MGSLEGEARPQTRVPSTCGRRLSARRTLKQLSVKGSWDLAVPTQLCRTLQGPLALPAWAMGGNVPAVISLPPIVFSRRPRRRGGGTPLIPLRAKPRWPTSSSGARGVPTDADHRRGAPCLCPAASLRSAVAQLERGSRLCSRAGDRRGPLHAGRRRARAGARGSGLRDRGSGLGTRGSAAQALARAADGWGPAPRARPFAVPPQYFKGYWRVREQKDQVRP